MTRQTHKQMTENRRTRERMARTYWNGERFGSHFAPEGGYMVRKHCAKPSAKWGVFGIELETEPKRGEAHNYRSMLRAFGNPYAAGMFPCSDGSLTGDGIEWKTDAGTLPWLFGLVDRAYAAMDANGYTAAYNYWYSCGAHIHIGTETFGVTKFARNNAAGKMSRLIGRFEEWFQDFAGRDFENWADSQEFLYNVPASYLYDYETTPYKVRQMHNCMNDRLGDTKYLAVNIAHNDTIELRIGAGVSTAQEMKAYLTRVQALVNLCKDKHYANEWFERCELVDFERAYYTFLVETRNMLVNEGLL